MTLTINGEGLTFGQWLAVARVKATPDTQAAWSKGEDPCDWRAEQCYFHRMDVAEAYYMFASLYHAGMSSREYKIFTRLHKIKFNPAPSLTVETLSENGRAIFNNLVSSNGFKPYEDQHA